MISITVASLIVTTVFRRGTESQQSVTRKEGRKARQGKARQEELEDELEQGANVLPSMKNQQSAASDST
jgi:hypothetical protein